MTVFQRWRFRAQARAIRADLDRLGHRLDHTENRINQLTTNVDSLLNAYKHIFIKPERNN